MKKLMIAVAIVCAAVASQAANYTWGLNSTLDENSSGSYLSDVTGWTAMQFIGTIGEKDNGDGTYSLDFSKVTAVLGTATEANGDYTIGSTAFDKTVKSDDVIQDTLQKYSLIVFESPVDDYTKYEGMYALVTGESYADADPTEGSPFMVFHVDDAITSDMYKTASAVPEPTSGLLLLLGVAGLALRRRRA